MKREEIVVGGTYTDGNGGVRLVLSDAERPYYMSQADQDVIRYRLIAKKRGPDRVGTEKRCTRASFAAWARRRVEE